jgi:hypothetical protein
MLMYILAGHVDVAGQLSCFHMIDSDSRHVDVAGQLSCFHMIDSDSRHVDVAGQLSCFHMIDSDSRPDSNWHPLTSLSQIAARLYGIVKSVSFSNSQIYG